MMSSFVSGFLGLVGSGQEIDPEELEVDNEKETEKEQTPEELNKMKRQAQMTTLKQQLKKALSPNLDKATLHDRLKKFFKEKKDKHSLKNLNKIVKEYLDKQEVLFELLSNQYPESDLSWFTNNPELYKRVTTNQLTAPRGKNKPVESFIPTGYKSTLNIQQEQALQALWDKLKDTEHYAWLSDKSKNLDGDVFLLRFLRATMSDKRSKGDRHFNVNAAFDRVVQTMEWRQKYVPAERPERQDEFELLRPVLHWKDSKSKVVVMMEKAGRFWTHIDPEVMSNDEWTTCLTYYIEQLDTMRREMQLERGDKDDFGWIAILDAKGLGIKAKKALELFKLFNSVSGDNYPECIKKVYLINAPWIFSKVFSIIKVFVDADTLAKVDVTRDVPREEFATLFDVEQLPEEYGGTAPHVLPTTAMYDVKPEDDVKAAANPLFSAEGIAKEV